VGKEVWCIVWRTCVLIPIENIINHAILGGGTIFKEEIIMGCGKCKKVTGVLLLVLGLLFLLADLGVWDWGLSWWTAVLLLAGVVKLAMSKCPDCKAMCKK
jgi:hypothetical protein